MFRLPARLAAKVRFTGRPIFLPSCMPSSVLNPPLCVALLYLLRAAWSGAGAAGDAFRRDVATRLRRGLGDEVISLLLPTQNWKNFDLFETFIREYTPGDSSPMIGIRRLLFAFVKNVEARLRGRKSLASDESAYEVTGLEAIVECALMRLIRTSDSIRVYGKVRSAPSDPKMGHIILRMARCLVESHLVFSKCSPHRWAAPFK
jgi:hypothetical protein